MSWAKFQGYKCAQDSDQKIFTVINEKYNINYKECLKILVTKASIQSCEFSIFRHIAQFRIY